MMMELTMRIPIIVSISSDVTWDTGILLPDHFIYTFSHKNIRKIFELKDKVRRSQSIGYLIDPKFEAKGYPWTGTADAYLVVSAYNFNFSGTIKKENLSHHWRTQHFNLYNLMRIQDATEKDIPLLINDDQIIVKEYAKQYLAREV